MLETVWFVLWGILWAFYFMLDGFDLGIGTLLPFLTRNETERRLAYNAIGPFWDGNEVWLITAGGVTFAAFPGTYAVMFSSLYSPLMIILFALILRGAAMELRKKTDSQAGRRLWDLCVIVGSFIPALLFGVAFANIFKGIPIDSEGVYKGNLTTLLNPYGLLGGVLFLLLFLMHGSLWLSHKTGGEVGRRAGAATRKLWPVLLIIAVAFLIYTAFETRLYENYLSNPLLFIIPLIAVVALLVVRLLIAKGAWWKAWFASCATIVGTTLFGVIGLYPSLFPSSLDNAYSQTIYNSASSPLTLKIMLVVVLIFVPIIIVYQGWVYILFRGKLTENDIRQEDAY